MANTKTTFKTLTSISVKDRVEKKGRFDYLSWAYAWAMVKDQYPDANRKVYESETTELNYFTDGTTGYGLGLSLWAGEDLVDISESSIKTAPAEKAKPTLKKTHEKWNSVVNFVKANKNELFSATIAKVEQKYTLTAAIKKELSDYAK